MIPDPASDRSDKFAATSLGTVLSQCSYCRHLDPKSADARCPAFPGEPIPDAILTNAFDHRKPCPGELGAIVFSPRPDVPRTILAQLYRTLDAAPKS